MGTNLVFGIFLVFCFLGCISAVPFSLFFPSGEGRGDKILQTEGDGDDISTNEIPLNTPIVYFDGTYSSIYVSLDHISKSYYYYYDKKTFLMCVWRGGGVICANGTLMCEVGVEEGMVYVLMEHRH